MDPEDRRIHSPGSQLGGRHSERSRVWGPACSALLALAAGWFALSPAAEPQARYSPVPRRLPAVLQPSAPAGRAGSGSPISRTSLELPDVERLPAPEALRPLRQPDSLTPEEFRGASPQVRVTQEEESEPVRLASPGPWWAEQTVRPLRPEDPSRPVSIESVVMEALCHSEFLHAARLLPRIHEEDIALERAQFDPTAFLESHWADRSEPVGSVLTTGRPTGRYNDHDLDDRIGVRKRLTSGAQVQLSQDFGYQNTNSNFFIPDQQATSRLLLTVSQPLMRNGGGEYNRSLIVLAQLTADSAEAHYVSRMQDHILRVAQAYWQLTLDRALLVQRQKGVQEARDVLEELQRRRELDLLQSQLLRAESAVATRTAALARADAAVRNREAELRALTNAPDLVPAAMPELIPTETPSTLTVPVDLSTALVQALNNRAEVEEAMQRVRSAQVRVGMANNELMPSLNVLLSAYVQGLRGNYDLADSLAAQFSDGAPSYTAGFVFEVPLDRCAAKANLRKRRYELSHLLHQMNDTLATISSEVEQSVRDVQTAQLELEGQFRALQATHAELDYLRKRWRMLPGNDGITSFVLSDILDTQDRLRDAEASYARSLTEYAIALTKLKRATGTLLIVDTERNYHYDGSSNLVPLDPSPPERPGHK